MITLVESFASPKKRRTGRRGLFEIRCHLRKTTTDSDISCNLGSNFPLYLMKANGLRTHESLVC